MKNYKRLNCRLCKSKNLSKALVLTPTPAPRILNGFDRNMKQI